jgi:glycosyltransferase involved in cell wall biosynthesis
LQRRLRAPLVLWLHEEPPRRDAALVRDRRIAWVVAGSEHLRAVAAADLRVPRDRIALLPAACERVQAGTRSVDGRLAVGIDTHRHGERLLEDLAAGLADLRRAGVSLRLVAVADGPRLRALRRGAGELQVQVLPSQAGCTAALVQSSDVVLHMPEREGHLLPVRLAMAMGRVAVVAGVGGAGELVRDGIDGRVVAPGNGESAIDAIRDLADAPLRRRQGQAAAAAAGNWSAAVVGEALIALYRTALGGGSVAQAATGSWCRRQTTRRHDPIGAGSGGSAPEAGLP